MCGGVGCVQGGGGVAGGRCQVMVRGEDCTVGARANRRPPPPPPFPFPPGHTHARTLPRTHPHRTWALCVARAGSRGGAASTCAPACSTGASTRRQWSRSTIPAGAGRRGGRMAAAWGVSVQRRRGADEVERACLQIKPPAERRDALRSGHFRPVQPMPPYASTAQRRAARPTL